MHNLANLYMSQGRYDEAEPSLSRSPLQARSGSRAKIIHTRSFS